jgi:hypothetical protein
MNVLLALDTAMGIFNNVPPRINYCELDLQLPCSSEVFQLTGYTEMNQRSGLPPRRMMLIEAFQKLFVHPSELKEAYQHEVLCCWDLLYLIHGKDFGSLIAHGTNGASAMFTHCWQNLFANPLNRISQTSLTPEPNLVYEPMKIALANWKTLWDDVRAKLPRASAKQMGFESSADSYWTLTKMLVLEFESKKNGGGATNITASGTTQHLANQAAKREPRASDDRMSGMSINSRAAAPFMNNLDFMPLEADCDSQGAHLRKILSR